MSDLTDTDEAAVTSDPNALVGNTGMTEAELLQESEQISKSYIWVEEVQQQDNVTIDDIVALGRAHQKLNIDFVLKHKR